MKYRQLTYQEFDLMQVDFSNYLYKQGFSRYEWRILQEQHSEFAISLLHQYSDHAFQKVMEDIHYLEYRKPKKLIYYHCKSKTIEIIGIEVSEQSHLDFTNETTIDKIEENQLNICHSFKKVKPYEKDREYEVFQLIESGRYVVNEENFKLINNLRKAVQN